MIHVYNFRDGGPLASCDEHLTARNFPLERIAREAMVIAHYTDRYAASIGIECVYCRRRRLADRGQTYSLCGICGEVIEPHEHAIPYDPGDLAHDYCVPPILNREKEETHDREEG